jgi:hypothetical protein
MNEAYKDDDKEYEARVNEHHRFYSYISHKHGWQPREYHDRKPKMNQWQNFRDDLAFGRLALCKGVKDTFINALLLNFSRRKATNGVVFDFVLGVITGNFNGFRRTVAGALICFEARFRRWAS